MMSGNEKKGALRLQIRRGTVMNEAFMVGRIYHATGEKETPAEIYEKLEEKCLQALRIR